jgi:hypothetical protein
MRSVLRSVVFAGPYVTHHPFWSKAEAMQQVMARKLTRGVSGHDRSHQLIAVQCLSSVLPPKFFLVGEIERFNVKKKRYCIRTHGQPAFFTSRPIH